METLKRFDVISYNGVAAVVLESEYLPLDPSVVVIPLFRDYPVVRGLNPLIQFEGQSLILATRLIVAVNRRALRHEGNIHDQGDKITRAIDTLMSGF